MGLQFARKMVYIHVDGALNDWRCWTEDKEIVKRFGGPISVKAPKFNISSKGKCWPSLGAGPKGYHPFADKDSCLDLKM
eukprot:NODE_11302_length_309_cov_102.461538_g10389_i0.p1 GENE.NODE_11302_length_309_cov_102.461538_g10389_i0~~NODE_11302_length_309_cov_102.461538_g10389_i0.p1  ORF type:complete len:87 (-),score=12.19 NODE_11302_length_309_cov_102.461538_g10389_i0:48-284(-)